MWADGIKEAALNGTAKECFVSPLEHKPYESYLKIYCIKVCV